MRLRLAFLVLAVSASLTFLLPSFWAAPRREKRVGELHAPAVDQPTRINPATETVLPNGRFITPRGKQVRVAPHPYGLALSPDGKTLVTVNSGVAPFSVSVLTNLESAEPAVAQIPPGFKSADADPDSVYLGVAIAPDDRTLYVAEGNNGRVGIFDMVTHQRLGSISLDGTFEGRSYANSLTGEMKLSPDGKRLYVLDLAHFRLVILDTTSRQIIASVGVGRLPFGLALSPDGRKAYVTNAGMFQYSLVPDYDAKRAKETGLDFPAFGFPSREAAEGAMVGNKKIPGVGDPNVPESNSLWTLDVTDAANVRVTARLKTGVLVGDQSVSGSSPGAVVAGREKVYVSNAVQDSITIVDSRKEKIEKTVLLEPAPSVRGLRGVLPFGMALNPDEKRLYVACAGINAVAVLDAKKGKVLGYFPTAWFPARLQVSPDGRMLYVSNAKGFGAGPNGGPDFHEGPEGTYIGDITKGTVSIVPTPEKSLLRSETAQVLRNNGFEPSSGAPTHAADAPIPSPGNASAKIHHVVFIVRENRTFDQVFGDITPTQGSHVEADASLTDFGDDAQVKNKDSGAVVEHARVTPNAHALLERFAFSDNYYVDSDVSVDGHHWLVGNYPNEIVESGWPAAYGDKLEFRADAAAPGRLDIGASNPWPESYLQAGSLWEHLARHKISFRNYGEGVDMPGEKEDAGLEPTGVREAVNMPMPEVLFENTSRAYPTFNTNISDQYRIQQFQLEFQVRYASGQQPLPQFIYIWLPNDHTAKPRPDDGYPFRASYVADNDLALGKLMELFSHSPFWKDMAVFVTEDDAQDGRDHVDAHRSILMVFSPYARRGFVSHVHTSMASILKTFDLIFGIPYLNQYDAAATDLSDLFTDQPDFTPYQALPADTRVFDPARVVEPGLELRARRPLPSERLDDPAVIRRLQRERLRRKDKK